MKKVLIISPHFPPVNSPDQHRVRMSLPFFSEFGWIPTVLTVDPAFVEGFRDPVLEASVPKDVRVIKVKAFSTKHTRKVGLGALGLRALWHMQKAGNRLLRKEQFDLIYFSTTAFHVCWLGQYWKRKFKIPFVIDLQDPWRNDFYLDKPKHLRPPKHGFAYSIHKKMEGDTMPKASGVVSVSKGYIEMMEQRYGLLSKKVPMEVIPFGASSRDFEIAREQKVEPYSFENFGQKINVAYIGAVTPFFLPIIEAFFSVFLETCANPHLYHFYFLGTSYTADAEKRIEKLAQKLGITNLVTEQTDRIPYFQALRTLESTDIIFIPGSQDKDYNASKVYNCILSKRPIFSIFNEESLVKSIIEESGSGTAVGVGANDDFTMLKNKIKARIGEFFGLEKRPIELNYALTNQFSDRYFTEKQTTLFERAISFESK